jgi:outer membrane protein assembly factor BamB
MARPNNFSEQIVVAEGIVLAVAEDSVVALDVATGYRLWTAAAPGAHLGGSGLAAEAGKGFLAMSSGRLVAWHLQTGQTAWTADTGMNMVARIVVERGVVCIGYDYAVLAVEAGTGRLLWETGGMGLVPVATREHFRVADGVLVAVTGAGGAEWVVDGLDVASGEVRWSVHGVSPLYRVITTGSTLYATAKGGPLSAYDAATGEQRWTYGNWRHEPIAANGRDVYIIGDGEIHAITAE